MIEHEKRSLDDGGPFALWVPAPDPTAPACGHGVLVETPLEALRAAAHEITLELYAAERVDDATVRHDTESATVTLSLATRTCRPADDRAARFLADRPWLDSALAERVDWLRDRQLRAVAQLHREPPADLLERFEPGDMTPFNELFPADWDLLLVHRGRTYWAIDHHCLNHACSCAEIVVDLHCIDTPKADHVGQARLDLGRRGRAPRASSPLAAELFAKLWKQDEQLLVRRRQEVRRAVDEHAAHAASARTIVRTPAQSRPNRNAPCPCGSGKKYKRCCGSVPARL